MQAFQGKNREFVGLANFIAYAQTPALLNSLWNSVWVSPRSPSSPSRSPFCLPPRADPVPACDETAIPWHQSDSLLAPSLLSAIS